ncbi:MAG: glycoside hydrolase family 3 protein [Clostridiales bacterium]|nr:glycoside hydrolase family 3 protein [Clostridiales bacterium]
MKPDLEAKPFCLDKSQVEWVESVFASMTLEEKVGQIFCPSLSSFGKKSIAKLTKEIKAGAVMIRPFPVKGLQESIKALQESSRIPMLISANLESGGNGAFNEGTQLSMPMGCAATGDMEYGYRLGKVACREAAAVGVNWSYAPIVDIDMNYRNPIVNVRSFGADAETVIKMSQGFIKAAGEEGVAPTIKHFPGDGTDERDQHLLVSVNTLTSDQWFSSYGHVYKTLIDDGAKSVMAAHIAQPEVARAIDPSISFEESLLPASLSKTLTTGLLREKLGFNGLVVTDSTLMTGFMQPMPRRKAVPLCIECGCDFLLFNRSVEEDWKYMLDGIKDGILSKERLDEAVLRVLATKASLGLNAKKTLPDPIQIAGSPETKKWVLDCADKCVTLVKDNQKLLPLSPSKHKRVYLNVIENYVEDNSALGKDLKARLEKEGFAVTLRKRKLDINPNLLMKGIVTPALIKVMKEVMANTDSFVSQYDMCMIALNMETVSNATVVRVNWKVMFGLGNDIPWYAGEMPLVVVSLANPYHLLDIPMADVYVNSYTATKEVLDATFDKLMGRSEFKGISPVDPFCGHEDCKL